MNPSGVWQWVRQAFLSGVHWKMPAAIRRIAPRIDELLVIGDRLHEEFGGIKDQAAEKWPLYGHGNGLFWDEPILSHGYKGKHRVIKEGMVMSTETFMALEGVGSAGYEQNFIVTADGTELITHTPLTWW